MQYYDNWKDTQRQNDYKKYKYEFKVEKSNSWPNKIIIFFFL